MSDADDGMAARRRALQLCLGVIWLLDAALQFQPYMFTHAFPRQVLAPVGPGNPGWIAHPVHWSAHIADSHIAVANATFATVQLLIALGLFTRSTVRLALVGSAVWGLSVWWLGEGLGGMLLSPQSPVMGAPGAAVLYTFVTVLLWPRTRPAHVTASPVDSVATTGPLRATGARLVWIALWGTFAVESLQAANRAPNALRDLVAGMADGEPRWVGTINHHTADVLAHHGTEVSIGLAICCALIALSVLGTTPVLRAGLTLAVILAALIWVVAQDFGEIATGEATDPNTAPLLILAAAAYWPVAAHRGRAATLNSANVAEPLNRAASGRP